MGMRHNKRPTATVESGTPTSLEEIAMVIVRVPRVFIYLVLAAATLLAALEVTTARGSASAPKADTQWADATWMSPLRDMDEAIARGDLTAAESARHEAYRAAIASRRWEGFLAVGDAVLRLGEATRSRTRAEPEARRLYLSALFRAPGQHSLDGVLLATEAFARLGDRDVVERGIRLARDLAGSDPDAQARVRLVEDRSSHSAAAGRDRPPDAPSADGAPAGLVR
jgi:hypothetical protein